jgi:hypothetical protein
MHGVSSPVTTRTVTTLCRLHAAQKCQFGAATTVTQ